MVTPCSLVRGSPFFWDGLNRCRLGHPGFQSDLNSWSCMNRAANLKTLLLEQSLVITSSKVVFSTVESLLGLCFIRENDAPVGERLLPARKVAAHLCARNMDRENQSDLNSELGSVIHFYSVPHSAGVEVLFLVHRIHPFSFKSVFEVS